MKYLPRTIFLRFMLYQRKKVVIHIICIKRNLFLKNINFRDFLISLIDSIEDVEKLNLK